MLAFVIYNFAYQMMYKSRRTKRGMIIFGQMFVIPAIVYSDDSYENLRNFFSFFCVIFFFFFFHPGMLFKYELKKMFTMKPKVHSCGSEFWMEQSHPEAYYNPKDQSRQILEFTRLIKFYV